jgi:hypothetical protein
VDPLGNSYTNGDSSINITFPYTEKETQYINVDYSGKITSNKLFSIQEDIQEVLDKASIALDNIKDIDLTNLDLNIVNKRSSIVGGIKEGVEFVHIIGRFEERGVDIGLFIRKEDPALLGFEIIVNEDKNGNTLDTPDIEYWQNLTIPRE